MDASLLNWLSSSENPAVRHLTALHLKPPSSIRTMKTLRRQMLKWEPWARILALQQEDGSFPSLDGKTDRCANICRALSGRSVRHGRDRCAGRPCSGLSL